MKNAWEVSLDEIYLQNIIIFLTFFFGLRNRAVIMSFTVRFLWPKEILLRHLQKFGGAGVLSVKFITQTLLTVRFVISWL